MGEDRVGEIVEQLRNVSTRRAALFGLSALGAIVPGTVGAKRCRRGKRKCNGRCILREACCTDAECSPPTSACIRGACVEPPA